MTAMRFRRRACNHFRLSPSSGHQSERQRACVAGWSVANAAPQMIQPLRGSRAHHNDGESDHGSSMHRFGISAAQEQR